MRINIYLLVLIIVLSYSLCEDELQIEPKETVVNQDWKSNMFSIGHGMINIGQFENNKPFKALSLMAMKHYWLNEYRASKNSNNVSERNRSFWWLLILNFYGIIDAYVDNHLKEFPENIDKDNEVESK